MGCCVSTDTLGELAKQVSKNSDKGDTKQELIPNNVDELINLLHNEAKVI